MFDSKKPTAKTTKDFVLIAEIRESVAIMKDGSLRSVIDVGSVNFDLKSSDEKVALVQAFQNFINSVDFTTQILINSRKMDLEPYLKSIEEAGTGITNELLKIQVAEYARFIKGLSELSNIMEKHFYISVPFYRLETASAQQRTKGLLSEFTGMFKSSGGAAASMTDQEFESLKIQLDQRIGVICGGLGGMGITTIVLEEEELKKVLYGYYNPGGKL
ncbi:MAG: hypothetical protein CEN90_500 [Parcubacteria group bacterium Licking1014_17]|nr:MAG: hypothetical protein CEN90_500 [Parcubacteria group bacterium Licking1014_17]